MIDDVGRGLNEQNEKIVECILHLREQRDELGYLIDKQCEERNKLETEMERISYKLGLINKSLGQRERAKSNYDKTLAEIEEKYNELVKSSGDLLTVVQKEFEELDSIINKTTSTDDTQTGDTDKENCCIANEKICKCDERKEGKSRKSAKKTGQSITIDIEPPTKLEKSEEKIFGDETSEVISDVMSECIVPKEDAMRVIDEESDEVDDYSLHFRKYS